MATARVQVCSTKEDWDALMQDKQLVVVDFHAVWCGPCKMLAPWLEETAKQFEDVKFRKVDVDELQEVAEECEVSAMPTIQIFKDGKKVAQIVGANKEEILKQIKANL